MRIEISAAAAESANHSRNFALITRDYILRAFEPLFAWIRVLVSIRELWFSTIITFLHNEHLTFSRSILKRYVQRIIVLRHYENFNSRGKNLH